MKIDDIRIAPNPLVLAAQPDVDGLESRLWVTFPDGYRDYVTRLGEGVLGSLIRVYPPWRIEGELGEWRRRINKYWFWNESRELLPKERALECVILGDTMNGDELIFHPNRLNHLFVLPRDSEQVFDAGADLMAAIEWMLTSGQLVEPAPDLNFVPFDSRLQADDESREAGTVADPEGESLDELVDAGKRWAERHSVREMAEKDVKKQVSDLEKQFGKPRKSTRLYEALVLDGNFPHEPGYRAVFRIDDTAAKLEVGTFTWRKSGDSQGAQFAPNQANLARLAQQK